MKFLLDTNVVSELIKPSPNKHVVSWIDSIDEHRIFISVVTIAELRYGIELMPSGARRNRLEHWMNRNLVTRFERRILAVDDVIANIWGCKLAHNRLSGRSLNLMDACIAAIAEHYELTVATRNTNDFRLLGTKVLNPWLSELSS